MDTRTSFFVVGLFGFMVWIGWSTSETGLCGVGVAVDALKKDGGTTCLEFWLNRYQTIIGAVLALIAAWIATIPARGQLREMSRQSAASGRQSMLDLASALEAEGQLIQRISSMNAGIYGLFHSYLEDNPHSIYEHWPNRWAEARRTMRTLASELRVLSNRYTDNEFNSIKRKQLLEYLEKTQATMMQINKAFRQDTSGLDFEDGEEELTAEEIAATQGDMERNVNSIVALTKALKEELAESARLAWVEVRFLEARALKR